MKQQPSTNLPPEAPRPATKWALDLAVASGLAALLDVTAGSAAQFGLFLLGLGFNSALLTKSFPRATRTLRMLYYLSTLPLFLLLSGRSRLSEEWMPVRVITYALLGGLYLLPLLERPLGRDLRRVTVILAGCFFFSAIYFSTPFFLVALLLGAFALFLAFHSMERPTLQPEKTRFLLRAASWHLVLTLVGGGLVFFAFPRHWFRTPSEANPMGQGLLSGPQPRSQDMFEVGVSSRRDMLQFPNLLDWNRSGAEVLRLRMTWNSTGEAFYATNSLYLRASLFESYADGNWRSRQRALTSRDADDGTVDGWSWVQLGSGQGSRRIRQHIQMRALDDICFCLPEPLAINQPIIKYETRGILIFPNKPLLSADYQVISELPIEYDDPRLREKSRLRIPLQMTRYLEVPANLRPILERINSRWDRRANRAILAEQIRQFLQSQFTYGPVNYAPEENMDAMQVFLTRSKQGYCTHFASAMALLARSMGLPARVATGFHVGGPPEPDGSYVIRELNAHAWTEIFFPDYGWVIFDATPPSQRPTLQQGSDPVRWWSFLTRFGSLTDQLAEYDSSDQKTFLLLLVSLFSAGLALAMKPWFWISLILAGLLAGTGFRKLPLRRRRQILQKLTRQKISSSVPFYADLLWVLARHGYPKPAALTPREFAESVSRQFPSPEVMDLTRQFYEIKFGGQDLTPGDYEEVRDRLSRVEAALADRKRNGTSAISANGDKEILTADHADTRR